MSATHPRVTFDELQRGPELGVLAILDTALTIARFTLIGLDPAVWAKPCSRPSPEVRNLRRLVAAIDLLAARIDAYVEDLRSADLRDDVLF